jgi:hypothetical protein
VQDFHIRKKNKTLIVETADNADVQPVKLKDLRKHIYYIEVSNKTSTVKKEARNAYNEKKVASGTGAGLVI